MKYYHTTLKSRIAKIKKEGLLIGKRRLWNNAFGAKLGNNKQLYLFSSFDEAIQWAGKMEWHLEQKIVIIELENLKNTLPDNNGEMQLSYKTACSIDYNISKNGIKKIIPLTLELTRAFIKRRDEKYTKKGA